MMTVFDMYIALAVGPQGKISVDPANIRASANDKYPPAAILFASASNGKDVSVSLPAGDTGLLEITKKTNTYTPVKQPNGTLSETYVTEAWLVEPSASNYRSVGYGVGVQTRLIVTAEGCHPVFVPVNIWWLGDTGGLASGSNS